MNTLPKSQLLEYLKHAISLEGAVVGQQNIIDSYHRQSESVKPVFQKKQPPTEPIILPVPSLNSDDKTYLFAGIGMLAMMALFLWMLIDLGGAFPFIMVVFCLCFVIKGFSHFLKVISTTKRIKKANEYSLLGYEEECAKINSQNKKKYALYKRDLQEWQSAYDQNMAYLGQKKSESVEVVEKFYSADCIFPKYRNLPALTSIYEYLTSGRCDELTGPNGAYNLYEMELRQNTVISQLNTIISNLEQIRQNQFTLYQELTKITSTVNTISYEMSAIRGYTYQLTELAALNTYYSAITAENTSALAFLEIMG